MVRLFLAVVVCATLAMFAINSRVGVPPVEAAAAGLRDASARSRQSPADSGERRRTQGATTLDDQVDLNVTVYNSDIALVRDVRTFDMPKGTFDLSFMDIAATVNPATVHFRSLTEPARVSVLEQNYEYDLLEPEKLLRKYVGRDVTLVRHAPGGRHHERRRGHGAPAEL